MIIRYDELKVNDIIRFYGAELQIIELNERPAPANEHYPNEKTISFKVKPANKQAEKIIGKYYAHGEYGGVGCLEIFLVHRN